MDFIKKLEAFCDYMMDTIINPDGQEMEFNPNTFTQLLDSTLLAGLYFKTQGLQYLSKEQYNILRDSLTGINSLTETRMGQVRKELPRLYKILIHLKELDKEGYMSLMFILSPNY